MSLATRPKLPPKKAVAPPSIVKKVKVVGAYSNIGEILNNKNTPAVTRVAACSKADTGVGNVLLVELTTSPIINSVSIKFIIATALTVVRTISYLCFFIKKNINLHV